ncbi:MAG: hypothetical protein U9P00_00585 [Pseudomonadota bacterium]|nr:hypothetical protein [Pseudomonadota bacterium]
MNEQLSVESNMHKVETISIEFRNPYQLAGHVSRCPRGSRPAMKWLREDGQ